MSHSHRGLVISECTTTLERNVSLDVVRAFKLTMIQATTEVGAAIARAYPRLTEDEGFELAGAAAGLAGMLYPMSTPPPVVEELYAREPAIAAARALFRPTIKRTLMAIALGLPALRESTRESTGESTLESSGQGVELFGDL